jgi:iron transport multicopper oxidase
VSDWYHDQLPDLLPGYMSFSANPDGAEPVPYSALMNEGSPGPHFQVQAGKVRTILMSGYSTRQIHSLTLLKTYLLRIINMAAFSQIYFHIDQHNMTIVEADGTYTHPTTVTDLYLATAQRYSVLVTGMAGATQNFAILASMDTNAYDNVPSYLNPNVTGTLVYDATKPIPSEAPMVQSFNPIDDYTLVPYDREAIIRGIPTRSITLDLDFATINGLNR